MALYKFILYGDYVGLVAARSANQARRIALTEEGRSNVVSVEKATAEDVAWIAAMGGRVPEDPYRRKSA